MGHQNLEDAQSQPGLPNRATTSSPECVWAPWTDAHALGRGTEVPPQHPISPHSLPVQVDDHYQGWKKIKIFSNK